MRREVIIALRVTLVTLILTGLLYPLAMTGIAQVLFHDTANGSLVRDEKGTVIGSEIIGQVFSNPAYLQGRPSAAGNGYDAASSSGTNLGPTSDKLINGVKDDPATKDVDETYLGFRDLAKAYREENGLAPDAVIPADAATRSGSGLDPDISPANADLQVARVAKVRGLDASRVREIVAQNTRGRALGFSGEPRVNVLLTNLALDRLK